MDRGNLRSDVFGQERGIDPAAQARLWQQQGGEYLHIVDLDGAFAGTPKNKAAIEAIVAAIDIPAELGGGIRDLETIEAYLGLGINRVILGTIAKENPDLVKELIIEGKGNYVLSVKENQPTLHQDIETTFAEAADARQRSLDEQPRPAVEVFEDVDKGHGRIETRTLSLCRDLSWMTTSDDWCSLNFVAQVVRQRTVLTTGETSTETAYFIGSDPLASASSVNSAVRRHWGIENKLHWELDLAFREDEARHRAKNTAQNMTTLRHFALNIVKQDPDRKLGVANTRKRAGWDRNYLVKLMIGAGQ
jgi:predicted transposase YbfD/YdcC